MALSAKSKKILLGALGVLAVLVTVVGVVLSRVDLNKMKPKIEAQASEAAGKPVRILGDIGWGLDWLVPSVVLQNVQVGAANAPDGSVGEIKIRVPLTALLAGEGPGGHLPSRIYLTLKDLSLHGHKLGDFTAPVHLSGDNLSIDPLEGDLPQGGDLKATLDYTDRVLTAKAEVSDIDYALVMPGASGGAIKGQMSLQGRGDSVDSILRGLDGDVSLYGGAGKLEGDAITMWADDLLSTVLTGSSDATEISCVVVQGKIQNGVLKPSKAVLDTKRVQVSAKGAVDFGAQSLNLLLTPAPKETALLSLATPLRVSGPWSGPDVKPDGRGIAEKAAGMLLGAVAPPAALLGFMKQGSGENPCTAPKE